MNVLIITDSYFPARTSASVLVQELTQAFSEMGVNVSLIVSSDAQSESIKFYMHDGCSIISVKGLKTKDVKYLRRVFNEFINPLLIWWKLRKSPKFNRLSIHGIIWYSPSIFWGPLIRRLKIKFQCKSYLILRDIFPDWALHLELISNGIGYKILKAIERYQYKQANTIGIQSPNNLIYFKKNHTKLRLNLEILWNWSRFKPDLRNNKCAIQVKETALAGRLIFTYIGNVGVAQGIHVLLKLINRCKDCDDIGFLIVGRGAELQEMKDFISHMGLKNALIFDEIESDQVPGLLSQCHVGLIFLDQRHKTHNIPGKFVTYMTSGLPVLAVLNPGNDLVELIPRSGVGEVSYQNNIDEIFSKVINLKEAVKVDKEIPNRCRELAKTLFDSKKIAQQIIKSLKE